MPIRLAAAAALMALALPVHAAETGLVLTLGSEGDFERRAHTYDCGTDTPLAVTYLNAAPNFLAIVPVEAESEPLVFASVISASGARYMSGQWTWWTRGSDAELYDATLGEDADPVLTCSEIINTP
jgi:membrane-bound inhibitor of C-type lysozyme